MALTGNNTAKIKLPTYTHPLPAEVNEPYTNVTKPPTIAAGIAALRKIFISK
jgi:hypothetical protein